MNALTFRFAGRTDAPAIAALIESAYRGEESSLGWTTEAHLIEGARTSVAEIEDFIAEPHATFLMAFDGATLVGCALLKNDDGAGYFGMFAVRPALQGAGLGKTILDHAERQIRDLWTCGTVKMLVINLRQDLIAYYERRGYRRTGERKPFPFDIAPGATRTDFHLTVLRKTLA